VSTGEEPLTSSPGRGSSPLRALLAITQSYRTKQHGPDLSNLQLSSPYLSAFLIG